MMITCAQRRSSKPSHQNHTAHALRCGEKLTQEIRTRIEKIMQITCVDCEKHSRENFNTGDQDKNRKKVFSITCVDCEKNTVEKSLIQDIRTKK